MKKHKIINIIAGEGGHLAQAKRFIALERDLFTDVNYILITDANITIPNVECYIERNISNYTKQRNITNLLKFTFAFARLFFNSLLYVVKRKPEVLISFGPVLAIPYLFWGKLLGVKVIHIETWSRFYTKSFAGRVAYLLADKFVIQNKELQKLYPNSIYGGRL